GGALPQSIGTRLAHSGARRAGESRGGRVRFCFLIWAWGCSVVAQTGCSTVLGMADTEEERYQSKIFVGVRVSQRMMSGGYGAGPEFLKLCFFIDFLPSLAADI